MWPAKPKDFPTPVLGQDNVIHGRVRERYPPDGLVQGS